MPSRYQSAVHCTPKSSPSYVKKTYMVEIGLLKLVAMTAGRSPWILVENFRSFISASGCGVILLLNKASTANGTDDNGV